MSTAVDSKKGELWNCTRQEYEEYKALRTSGLLCFAYDGPQDYYYWYVNPAPPKPSTDALEFGTHFHAAALENKITWKTSKPCEAIIQSKKSARSGEACGHPGITIEDGEWKCGKHSQNEPISDVLTEYEDRDLRAMLGALNNHDEAMSLIQSGGFEEHGIKFNLLGIPCKTLLDRLQHNLTIVDLKTIRQHSEWAIRKAVYGQSSKEAYYLRAAFHVLAREAVFPGAWAPYFLVFVSKQAPHPVIVVELPDEVIEAGKRKVYEYMKEFRRCWKEGDWSHRYGHGRVLIEPPQAWVNEHQVNWGQHGDE